MKIAVLLGGDSPERAVSLDSGKNIVKAIETLGYSVFPFDPAMEPAEHILQFPQLKDKISLPKHSGGKLYMNLLLLSYLKVDVVFNALHGGDGENGVVQTLLEQLNIKSTGPGSVSSMLAMDKVITKSLLHYGQIPVARSVTVHSKIEVPKDIKPLSYPVIVKPADGGSSLGHTVLQNGKGLQKAVMQAFKFGSKVLIEEFVEGKEIAAGVLNGRALPLVHIKPKHGIYDYDCKYTPGMSSYEVPADLPLNVTQQIQEYALQSWHILQCSSYCRVDFLLSKENKPIVLEVNTLPGMTSTSLFPKAAKNMGFSFERLIDELIKEVVKRDENETK